jgi:hypothetical protein
VRNPEGGHFICSCLVRVTIIDYGIRFEFTSQTAREMPTFGS